MRVTATIRPDRSREQELLRRYSDTRDPEVQEELVRRFMPLARSLARRYQGGSESLDDLIQVANLGLVKALAGFDPRRGGSFPAYAAPTILGELRKHFRDHVFEIRLPRGLQERTLQVSRASTRLGRELGRSPSVAEVAERTGLDEEQVIEVWQAEQARQTLSLDVPRAVDDEESRTMLDTIPSREPGYDAIESQLAANTAPLEERERRVLRLRFEEDMTQSEIGRRMGVSQMQISRIMRGGLHKLLGAVQGELEAA
jgi:RNA polymerase sigma-B factor